MERLDGKRGEDPFELRKEADEARHDVLRGALLYRALVQAAALEAVLVVGESAPGLAHANLADVVAEGSVEERAFTLVRDLRDARTIAELVATHGAAHWQEAVELGRHLARALAALHAIGLAHGDLALSTVHVNARWEPILTRNLLRADGAPNLVALGEILYALLTGKRPADAPVPPRAANAEIPERLERLVLDLMAGGLPSATSAAVLLDALRA